MSQFNVKIGFQLEFNFAPHVPSNLSILILAKIQNWPSNFHLFSFQSSNFQFCQFSPLTFNFCQFKALLQTCYCCQNDTVLNFFFNSELKEKSGKKEKRKEKKKRKH